MKQLLPEGKASLAVVASVVSVMLLVPSVKSDNISFALMSMTYVPPSNDYFYYGTMGAACPIAIEDLRQYTNIQDNHTISYFIQPSQCDQKIGLSGFVTAMLDRGAAGSIMDCSAPSLSSGLLASVWKVPMVSYGAASPTLSDKNTYNTFVRVFPPYSTVGSALLALFRHYNWTTVGMLMEGISDPTFLHISYVQQGIQQILGANNVTLVTAPLNPLMRPADIRTALLSLATGSRILILAIISRNIPAVLLQAMALGFIDNNDYVFITMDLIPGMSNTQFPWMNTTLDPNKTLANIYPYVLHTIYAPFYLAPNYASFLSRMMQGLSQAPFFVTNITKPSQVSPFAPFTYDSTIFFALTFEAMMRDGVNYRDGSKFLQYAQKIVFKGITGSVSIDKNGDRRIDYQLYHYGDGTFYPAINYNSLLDSIDFLSTLKWPGGQLPPSMPRCGYQGELCIVIPSPGVNVTSLGLGVAFAVVVLLTGVVGVTRYLKQRRYEERLLMSAWTVDLGQLQAAMNAASRIMSMTSYTSNRSGAANNANSYYYKSVLVYTKKLMNRRVDMKNRDALMELKLMRDLSHENVNSFLGLGQESDGVMLVWSHCAKGSLYDILGNDDIKIDFNFAMSFAEDIAQGMNFLHKSDLKVHGNLKSKNCVVNSRWTVKLQGFGPNKLLPIDDSYNTSSSPHHEHSNALDLVWTAPEHLRDKLPGSRSQKGDVYSYAIILHEITLQSGPFGNTDLTSEEIVQLLKKTPHGEPFRPLIPESSNNIHPSLLLLMRDCWAEDPHKRPDFAIVAKRVASASGRKRNLVDNMVGLLEKYASNLEGLVAQRTRELADEKERADRLLYQMLPKSIAEQLKKNVAIMAEDFDCVTIYFSDVVGFTSMSAMSTPQQVVVFLNDLYTGFDDIIQSCDVYKVETIGDAYMIVSGLPNRNGLAHAGEIATAALKLLAFAVTFRIRHLPERKMLLRIGIHSGPCVSGVVGLKMPRYCLFGDTVNTASRMESNGKPWRIHASEQTIRIIEQIGGYHYEDRGLVEMKGKGKQHTYWLTGKDGLNVYIPPLADTETLSHDC